MVEFETTSTPEEWICPSCNNAVPYGFAHVCPAKTSQEAGIPVYPTQVSLQELTVKLDIILADVKKIKKKTDKIKDK